MTGVPKLFLIGTFAFPSTPMPSHLLHLSTRYLKTTAGHLAPEGAESREPRGVTHLQRERKLGSPGGHLAPEGVESGELRGSPGSGGRGKQGAQGGHPAPKEVESGELRGSPGSGGSGKWGAQGHHAGCRAGAVPASAQPCGQVR